jgi:hypothetical protein
MGGQTKLVEDEAKNKTKQRVGSSSPMGHYGLPWQALWYASSLLVMMVGA